MAISEAYQEAASYRLFNRALRRFARTKRPPQFTGYTGCCRPGPFLPASRRFKSTFTPLLKKSGCCLVHGPKGISDPVESEIILRVLYRGLGKAVFNHRTGDEFGA
jgi:hypothetical protein